MTGIDRYSIVRGTAAAAIATVMVSATVSAAPIAADPVLFWNDQLLSAVRASTLAPPQTSRAMAMVHTAVFNAANAVSGAPYASYGAAPAMTAGASMEAAVAQAAYDVLADTFSDPAGKLALALGDRLAMVTDGPAKAAGQAVGQAAAASILALRQNDGSKADVQYTPGTAPGDWRPTPPKDLPALLPQWAGVDPWAMSSGDQFRPGGPPSLDSTDYADDYNETKQLGAANSSTRTDDQTAIAKFWADGPGTVTPPGHWLWIASEVVSGRNLATLELARLFSLLSMTLADAAIVAWDCKYVMDLWRPITAIHNADSDGNPDTNPDLSWLPLITTPPFPEYVSGHSTFSGAAAHLLTLLFGDDVSFCARSDVAGIGDRCFDSFWAAAEEAGRSRIFGGIHWQFSNEDGLNAGRGLAEFVHATQLLAVAEPAALLSLAGGLASLGLFRRRRVAHRP